MSNLLAKIKSQRAQMDRSEISISVCFYVFFPAGGIGRYTNKLLSSIATNTEISVVAACSPEYQWKTNPSYNEWDGLFSISHNIPVVRRARFLIGQFLSPIRLCKYVKENNIDIVHFSNVNHLSFPLWKKAIEKSGARVVISVHDVKRQKRILNRKWEDKQLKALYRFSDGLFVHSEYQAQELVEFAGIDRRHIQIVPHGPYVYQDSTKSRKTLFKIYEIPQGKQVALFVGQLRDEKNLDGLHKALTISKANLFLIVAAIGGGKHRNSDYYQQYANELGLSDRVLFLSKYIPDEEVGELFSVADWVAIPYRKSFTSQSGVLNVAVHFERPSLVCSSPVLRETIEACDIGVICKNDTSESIAQGIDEICARVNQGHAHQYQDYRIRYSWKENALRTLKVYEQIVNNKR